MVRKHSSGLSLIELVIVLAIVTALVAVTTFAFNSWAEQQRVKSSARAVADAFMLGRAQAIRTGRSHLVVFGVNALTNADSDIVIVDDDEPDDANCSIVSSEIIHRVNFEGGVSWGTSDDLADTAVAPDDTGIAVANTENGSSFTTAALDATSPASWVVFQPDGIPRLFTTSGSACTAISQPGEGGGAIYVTNGSRDYVVVLAPLGTARVLAWNDGSENWMN